MAKKIVFPPVKYFITGSEEELTIDEAKIHIRRISNARLKNREIN